MVDGSVRRILIAEDDDNDFELAMTALSDYNLTNQIDRTTDGAETLDYLRCKNKFADRDSHNPVAILLDLKMPKINGIDVLREIRGDERLKLIPVVVLTSSHEDADLKACYEMGVNAYVVKPVDFPKFLDAIRKIGGFWALYNEPPPEEI
jgi:CheY-like chemotaxis protein